MMNSSEQIETGEQWHSAVVVSTDLRAVYQQSCDNRKSSSRNSRKTLIVRSLLTHQRLHSSTGSIDSLVDPDLYMYSVQRWTLYLRSDGLTSILNFKVKKNFLFFFMHRILLVTKVKLSQGTIDRNRIVLLKNCKNTGGRVRANSDFMILVVDVYFNFHIGFPWYLIYRSCSISVSLNNQMIKLTVGIIRNVNVTSTCSES